jgi:hypothetical protein
MGGHALRADSVAARWARHMGSLFEACPVLTG